MLNNKVVRGFSALVTCVLLNPATLMAEPLFDNNGYTIRDKISTWAFGYSNKSITYKGLDSAGSSYELEANCLELGYADAERLGQAFFISYSHCDNAGLADGTESDDSARFASLGYLYAAPGDRVEFFAELKYIKYPSVAPFSFILDSSTNSFSGYEYDVGMVIDFIDGARFNVSLGFDLELYSKYDNSSIERDRKFEAFLKSSYLFDGDWAIVARLAGYGREGFGLTIMKSFE